MSVRSVAAYVGGGARTGHTRAGRPGNPGPTAVTPTQRRHGRKRHSVRMPRTGRCGAQHRQSLAPSPSALRLRLHRTALPNLPFYGTTLPTKGVSSPSVTVLSRAVTHRDTAAMPGWFNRAATGQLAGPRSAAMPSPHGGRAARITFGAMHAANTSQRERPLRSPALQQGRTQPCSPRGSWTARAPCICPAAVGAAEPGPDPARVRTPGRPGARTGQPGRHSSRRAGACSRDRG
jgi:hypothetical protein